jgi:hypothetical protein
MQVNIAGVRVAHTKTIHSTSSAANEVVQAYAHVLRGMSCRVHIQSLTDIPIQAAHAECDAAIPAWVWILPQR